MIHEGALLLQKKLILFSTGTPNQFQAHREIQPCLTNKWFAEGWVKTATPVEKLKFFKGYTSL